MNRYSAIAVFDADLDRVVLIEKQKPAWQVGKANFPGGKVEDTDWPSIEEFDYEHVRRNVAHLHCAIRELKEETGLVVDAATVKHFTTLHFTTAGEPGECHFFCCVGDIDVATTKEMERVFIDDVFNVMLGEVSYTTNEPRRYHFLATMSNLPWLVAMARQRLRDGNAAQMHDCTEVRQ